MKKVFIQIVDPVNGTFQTGSVSEPIKEGFELHNTLSYFGLNNSIIEWEYETNNIKVGKIKNTSKEISLAWI